MNTRTFIVAIALVLGACREDPGVGDYTATEGLREKFANRDAPDPFDPATPRLGVLFYESDATDDLPFQNGSDIFFFLFDTVGDGTGDFTVDVAENIDRVEGTTSRRFVHAGLTFWGAGHFYYNTLDASEFTNLHMSMKSANVAFAAVALTLQWGPPRPAQCDEDDDDDDPTNDVECVDPLEEFTVDLGRYTYENNGMWHNMVIPLADFEGLDASSIRGILISGGPGGPDEQLLVDNVYLQ